MVQKSASQTNGAVNALIQECAATLEKIAAYKLPPALDGRLLWLAENKERLTQAERDEMLALIDFSEDRTVEKLQAKLILQRIAQTWPQLFGTAP